MLNEWKNGARRNIANIEGRETSCHPNILHALHTSWLFVWEVQAVVIVRPWVLLDSLSPSQHDEYSAMVEALVQ